MNALKTTSAAKVGYIIAANVLFPRVKYGRVQRGNKFVDVKGKKK